MKNHKITIRNSIDFYLRSSTLIFSTLDLILVTFWMLLASLWAPFGWATNQVLALFHHLGSPGEPRDSPNGPKWSHGLKKSSFWSPKWPRRAPKSIPERPLDVKKCYKTTPWPRPPRSSTQISKTENRNVQEQTLSNSTRHGGGDCPQGNGIYDHTNINKYT